MAHHLELQRPAALCGVGVLLVQMFGCSSRTAQQLDYSSGVPPASVSLELTPIPSPVSQSVLFEARACDADYLSARAGQWDPSVEVVSSAEDRLLDAVAVLTFREQLTGSEAARIRAQLRDALPELSSKPYQFQLAHLYLLQPAIAGAYGMVEAPDAQHLIYVRDHPDLLHPLPDHQYLPATLALFEEAQQSIRSILPSAELEARERLNAGFSPSPLFEDIFKHEAAPPEVERRARIMLAELMAGLKGGLEEVIASDPHRSVDLSKLFQRSRRFLIERCTFKNISQPSVTAGLATGYVDCDVLTLVMVEFGRQVQLPIEALYVIDITKPKSVGHCLPAIFSRQAGTSSVFAFEMRDPIEILPNGDERREYQSFQEMIQRINRLAGEQLLSEGTIVCRLTDQAKVGILPRYGKNGPVELRASEMRIEYGRLPQRTPSGAQKPR